MKSMEESLDSSIPIISLRKFKINISFDSRPGKPIELVGSAFNEWTDALYHAQCLCYRNQDKNHAPRTVPEHYFYDFTTATCGVYSFKLESHELLKTYPYDCYPISAIVKNYGFILEMEQGYRSEFCEIISISSKFKNEIEELIRSIASDPFNSVLINGATLNSLGVYLYGVPNREDMQRYCTFDLYEELQKSYPSVKVLDGN